MALYGIALLAPPQNLEPVKTEATNVALAKQHYETGALHFGRGEFEEALAEFEEAYGLSPRPRLQYNIGMCYLNLLNYKEVRKAFQIYMDGTVDDPGEEVHRSKVGQTLKDIEKDEAALRARDAQKGGQAVSPPSPPPPQKPKIKSSQGTAVKIVPRKSYKPWMRAAFVLGGVGAVGGGVALSLGMVKEDKHSDQLKKAIGEGGVQCRGDRCRYANESGEGEYHLNEIKRDMERFGTLSKIGFAVGGAALVTGGILFMLDRRPVRVAPKVEAGGVGVEAQIRW